MPRPELDFQKEYQGYFDEPAGKEHYRLLEKLSLKASGLVVDVGTLYGSSALALSHNPEVRVVSYDIKNHIPDAAAIRAVPNITFVIGDGVKAVPEFAKLTDLIVLDIDPHDGIQEAAFFAALVDNGYAGIVVCDDIHLNAAMEAWWASIEQRKEDLTLEGHWSGTGIVYF
jgi:protein-L-isoaspartate O-methyltransferase